MRRLFSPELWDLRQSGFILALTQVDSLLAYNYLNFIAKGKECINKATLTLELAKELMRNDDAELAKELESDDATQPKKRKKLPNGAQYNSKKDRFDLEDHSLCRLDPYRVQM